MSVQAYASKFINNFALIQLDLRNPVLFTMPIEVSIVVCIQIEMLIAR